MKTVSKTRIFIIVTLFLLYAVSYGVARSSNWLIHRSGYYSEAGQSRRVAEHYISPGDFGTSMLAQGVANIFFWPAAKVELVYWYLIVPRDSQWQDKEN